VVPEELRGHIKKRLHHSHSGIEATNRLVRDAAKHNRSHKEQNWQLFSCIKASTSSQKKPMQSIYAIYVITSSDLPFQFVSMDLMEIDDKDQKHQHYLITVDHYSDLLEDQKSSTIIGKCTTTH
jgi:hypothetical protein